MSIESFSYALPSIKNSYRDIAEATGADPNFIRDKVGLRERYVLGPDESSVSLSVKACENLFTRIDGLREEVELLVCVTQNPDRRIPHNAGLVAENLGLSNQLASFDVSLGCSGYVYGVQIVEAFLASTGMETAVLVTCDPYSRVMALENRDTNAVFGDAATATLIRANGDRSFILSADFGTDGSGADGIRIPAGGALKPFVSLNSEEATKTYSRDQLRLHMEGRAVFNFVMTKIPYSINCCLAKANRSIDEIDHFILHQGSTYMLKALTKRAKIPLEKTPINMDRYGNTVSSTLPLLLAELDEKEKLKGTLVLLSGFGVGLSWGSMLVKFH